MEDRVGAARIQGASVDVVAWREEVNNASSGVEERREKLQEAAR